MSRKRPDDTAKAGRLLSLDAFRGLVMFFLVANGFGIAAAAKQAGDSAPDWMRVLAFHNDHPEWVSQFYVVGLSLWDMIQPCFMFIVGVSMPWSYAKRAQLGHSYFKRARHAWGRALLLVALGIFLTSQWGGQTNWQFTNVLCQIGLGYGFLFFLVGRSFRIQGIVGALVLVAFWLFMVLHPAPEGMTGWAAHFQKGTNAAAAFDQWFLNLFPREKPYDGNTGGYTTLNFVPAFVTMLMGVMCGQYLKEKEPAGKTKVVRLAIAGATCLVLGAAAGFFGLCPVVKRLWTPSWVLFSGAWCIWLLAVMYGVVDLAGWKRWTYPFIVVGLNPITAYVMSMAMKSWVRTNLKIHLPDAWFTGLYGPVVEAGLTMLVFWLILWWMHRRRIYLRI